MATQRITLLKFGGVAGDEILRRLTHGSDARTSEPDQWGEDQDQWPDDVRHAARWTFYDAAQGAFVAAPNVAHSPREWA